MIPSGYKDGKVYSVLPANGDGDFDFTRGSNATRVNKDGLIETATGDTPRLDYSDSSCPSLLLEPQRTNLVSYSEDFSDASWNKLNLSTTSNSVISPDGTLNASSFTQSGGTAEHGLYNTLPTLTSGSKYTGSVFLKYDDWQYFQVRFRSGGFGAEIGVIYDAINKAVTTTNGSLLSYNIEEYANDWVRISIAAQATSDSNFAGLVVAYNNSGNVFNDPDSVPNTGANVYAYGAQVEEGDYPTSYIPTQGSAVTRLADECINGGNDQVINSTEGTLYVEARVFDGSNSTFGFSLTDGGVTNRTFLTFQAPENKYRAYSTGGGITDITFTGLDVTSMSKVAIRYSANSFSLWINGSKRAEDLSYVGFSSNVLNNFSLDRNSQGQFPFYGNVKDARLYNTALTDAELIALTS